MSHLATEMSNNHNLLKSKIIFIKIDFHKKKEIRSWLKNKLTWILRQLVSTF